MVVETLRDGQGRWLRGVSGNPGGRPLGLARLIAEQTGGGQEIVDRVVDIMRTSADARVVLEACTWLADRLWGKPRETVEVEQVQRQLRIIIHAPPADE